MRQLRSIAFMLVVALAAVGLFVAGLGGLRFATQHGLIPGNGVEVHAMGATAVRKVRVSKDSYSIDCAGTQRDAALLQAMESRLVFDGEMARAFNADYGESDFVVTYDDRWYLWLRHLKLGNSYLLTYRFDLRVRDGKPSLRVDIEGADELHFEQAMVPTSEASRRRCNELVDGAPRGPG